MPATRRPDAIPKPSPIGASPGTFPTVGASVDLGSTSVHLLVAAVAAHRLQPLIDESVFLGLGSTVAERGHLGRSARTELTATLVRYAGSARRLGAIDVTFLGTEPIRRAADGSAIVHEVGIATGAPMHVLSHEEEAYLTIIGVTEGLPVTHQTLVVDIGGGSSEFCIVDATQPPQAAGLRLGSARLTDRFVHHDPPLAPEVEAMRQAALEAIRDGPAATPTEIVAVGGTASNLLKVVAGAALDRTLTRASIHEALAILATEPAAVASERHRINPIRARILPAGAVILEAILGRYGIDEIRVSEAGIREGAILAVDHAGPAWRDRLAELADGWRR
jgi:exopolyphosphatase/guanosine-5'-triphosphate,3'-diphosphate pyrophosphatase